MNVWECEHPGCKNTCRGVGRASGLQAIGWYFKPGESFYKPGSTIPNGFKPALILCPDHRPTLVAQVIAERLQTLIESRPDITEK